MPHFSSWNNYYKDRKPHISNILLHWQYLAKIVWLRPKKILEIGCGPAEHSLFIKKILPDIRLDLLDLDRKLLTLVVRKNSGLIDKHYVADITSWSILAKLHLTEYDLVISQGLMEHFPDKVFLKVISHIGKFTGRYLFSVPSNLYPNQDYGNEILRSKEQISQLLSQVPGITYRVTPYLDIGFRTKIATRRAKKMSLLTFIKYFIFASLHILVEIKYK